MHAGRQAKAGRREGRLSHGRQHRIPLVEHDLRGAALSDVEGELHRAADVGRGKVGRQDPRHVGVAARSQGARRNLQDVSARKNDIEAVAAVVLGHIGRVAPVNEGGGQRMRRGHGGTYAAEGVHRVQPVVGLGVADAKL